MAKKKYRNTETGQIEEYDVDANGRPITQPQTASPSVPKNQLPKHELRAPTFADQVFNVEGGRELPQLLPGVGGMIGGTAGSFGGPAGVIAGSAIGSGLGTVAGQTLQRNWPQYFGQYKQDQAGSEIGKNIGIDLMLGGASKVAGAIFPSVRQRLFQQLSKYLFPAQIDDATKAAIAADPEFKYTVGQVNPTARTIENVAAPTAKNVFVKEQNKQLTNKASQLARNPEITIGDAQTFAQERVTKMRAKSDALYKRFEPAIIVNTKHVEKEIPGQPITISRADGSTYQIKGPSTFEPVAIEGAIPLNRSKTFADNLGGEIKKILGPDDVNSAKLGQGTTAYLKQIQGELDNISSAQAMIDPQTKQTLPTVYESFNKLKELRDSLNRFTQSSEYKPLRNKLEGTLQALESAIRSDMDEGVKSWGPNAYKRFRIAQDYWQEVAKRQKPEIVGNLLAAGKSEVTPMQIAKEAMNDPQRTREFVGIAGRDKATRLFNDNLHNAAITGDGKFDPQAALEFLKTNDLIAKEALPSKTLSEYRRFWQRAAIVGQHVEGSRLPMLMKLTSAGLGFTVGAGNFVAGHGLPMSATFGLLTLKGAHSINKAAEKWLLNPRTARIATGLLDADPASAKAKLGQKAILATMVGMRASFMAEDGREFPVEIMPGGKLKPVKD